MSEDLKTVFWWYVVPAIVVTLILALVATVASADELKASWYSEASLVKEGTRKAGEAPIMANGKRFDENAMTCACRLYPLGTKLIITNQKNGRSVQVVVTDRIGKRFAKTRIDLSKKSFQTLTNNHLELGLISIEVRVIDNKSSL